MQKLYLIGNGFDLSHGLPSSFSPHFRDIANRNENNTHFWDLYQTQNSNIWSDFEILLAFPDFNELVQIFCGYIPDYLSDSESDRDAIILQSQISGQLHESLREFAI